MIRLPAWFWPWAAWRDAGRVDPRPASAPAYIPVWLRVRYRVHWASRRPAPPRPLSRFESRGVLTTYGMENGDLRAGVVAARAKANSYTYVAAEYTAGNAPHLDELREACKAWGVDFGIWDPTPSAERVQAIATHRPALVVLESEGAATDWAAIKAAMDTELPGVPWAVITNLSGLDDPALQAAGVPLLTECYLPENANATPARMDAAAKARGYLVVVPCIGVYHGYALAAYLPLPYFAVYAAEYMTDADWLAR